MKRDKLLFSRTEVRFKIMCPPFPYHVYTTGIACVCCEIYVKKVKFPWCLFTSDISKGYGMCLLLKFCVYCGKCISISEHTLW